jgi:hypothetical protein
MKYGDVRKVYECPACGGYHLATPPENRNASNRDRRRERRAWRREHGR